MKSQIDHLVVAAHSLQQGIEWCESVFGITPDAGGEHENTAHTTVFLKLPRLHFLWPIWKSLPSIQMQ